MGKIFGVLGDAAMLLAAVVLLPAVILLVGAPIALCLRGVIAIAHRF